MAISLSTHLLETMGFRQIPDGESLIAEFHGLYVYHLRGITLELAAHPPINGEAAGIRYQLAVGSSINALCQVLMNDDFTDDEAGWEKENKSLPPYAMVHLGPTKTHTCTTGHFKEEGSGITTMDCFPQAREELRQLSEEALPSIVSSITFGFNTVGRPVDCIAITRQAFGITSNQRTLHDIRFTGNAGGYISRSMAVDEAEKSLKQSVFIAGTMNPKVSQFFYLASQEEDLLKQFLYFFLSIEVETHAVFQSIDHSSHMSTLVTAPERIRSSTAEFFARQREGWTSLQERFIWCAICIWTHLSDSDIEDFKAVKRVRNDIAHGAISMPTVDAVWKARALAIKLQQPQ